MSQNQTVRIDEASMKRVRDALSGIRNGAPKAVARAVNQGLSSGQKAIVDGVYAKAALKKKDIRQHINPVKASASKTQNPQARIDIKGCPLNLFTYYGAKPAGKQGISFRIWRDGKREKYKHAFIATLIKARYSGVFEVNIDSPRYKEGRRTPWRRKSGPSVPNIYSQTPGLAKKAEEIASEAMMKELDRQVGLIDRGLL